MSHSLRLLRTLAAILLAATLASPAAAAVWRVKAGESIQAAIDRAELGDTIEIERARYFGHLLVDKPLTLRGIDRPTIDGELKENTISVKAENVTIDGLIVANSGGDTLYQHAGIYIYPGSHKAVVRNCDFSYTLFGLWIEKADDVLIENNLITGKRDFDSPKRGNGIQLYNTQRARIIGNNVSFVRDAIYVDVSHDAIFRGNKLHHSRYGTHYMTSYRNIWEDNETWYNRGGLALMEVRDQIVRNNRAWGNSDHGIMLRTIQDAVIENNVVAGNQRGFFIYDAEYNEIRGNQVIDNVVGIHLWAGSKNNKVEGNDFIANREQIRYVAARDMIWGAEEGNYWSNYLGWDRNGDGAGDVQYEANDMVDRLSWRHPMMKLLLASPAVQTLRLVGQQFPLLRAPSIVDPRPRMQPHNPDWSQWRGRYFPRSE
ncbi:MAG: nitrous oxide reductase family maturation protein NosD [Thauera propionica]|jgi:nitrous oxidase accessory protein|uniref:Copper ABC transporter substrate-binding protein n=2 Tax=Thauera TaxID=33057 RepID=A0A235EWU7_9RHOO|nr:MULTISPECIES: nitrous oxide reductase family maturation protein NosD [Thauera]MDY0046490.1 nitrous oxide reductase family maturation protein NosD [Thauera propionica]OYD53528.1 copper ABC transporter substrate-binding protein [Thauera propionica]